MASARSGFVFFFSLSFTLGEAIEKFRDGVHFWLLKRNKQTCAQLFETNSALNQAALASRDSEVVSCIWSQKCERFYPFPDPCRTQFCRHAPSQHKAISTSNPVHPLAHTWPKISRVGYSILLVCLETGNLLHHPEDS